MNLAGLILLVFCFVVCDTSATALAYGGGDGVGNGGDAIACEASPANEWRGYYSLDYLAELSPNETFAPISNISESLMRIENLLKIKAPELAPSFSEFLQSLFNESNYRLPRVWEPTNWSLVDLNDQNLISVLPPNCFQNGHPAIIPAVIRENPLTFPLPGEKIVYKYVKQVIQELNSSNPLQLSFLIVHEWLWDISKNVNANRRINHLLHSTQMNDWDRATIESQLRNLGVAISDPPFSPSSSQATANSAPNGQPFRIALVTRVRLMSEAFEIILKNTAVQSIASFQSINEIRNALASGLKFDVVVIDEFLNDSDSSQPSPEKIWTWIEQNPNVRVAILGVPEDRYKFPICLPPSNVSFFSRELVPKGPALAQALARVAGGPGICVNE